MVGRPDLGKTAKMCKNLHKFVRNFVQIVHARCSPEIVRITIKSGGLVGLKLHLTMYEVYTVNYRIVKVKWLQPFLHGDTDRSLFVDMILIGISSWCGGEIESKGYDFN